MSLVRTVEGLLGYEDDTAPKKETVSSSPCSTVERELG